MFNNHHTHTIGCTVEDNVIVEHVQGTIHQDHIIGEVHGGIIIIIGHHRTDRHIDHTLIIIIMDIIITDTEDDRQF